MKFNISRKFSLDSLGEAWKDCYVEFSPVTIREVQDITELAKIDPKDTKSVAGATGTVVDLLKKHFLGGKAIGDKGEVVDIAADDLIDLPVDVMGGMVAFLLGSSAKAEGTPSTT